MRCHQVRERLNRRDGSPLKDEEAVLQHLQQCDSCAHYARAEMALRRDFDCLSPDDAGGGLSLGHLKTRVEAHARPVSESVMSAISRQLKKRPRTSVAITFAFAVLLFATVIPFKMNQTIGYEVAFAGVDKNLAMDSDKIHELLNAIGVTQADIELGDCEQTCNLKIIDLKTQYDVQMVLTAFDEMGNVEFKGVQEITEEESGSVLNHAKNTFYTNIIVSAHHDGELHELVIHRLDSLKESGDGDFTIFFERAPRGDSHLEAVPEITGIAGSFGGGVSLKLTEHADNPDVVTLELGPGEVYELDLTDPATQKFFQEHGLMLGENADITLINDSWTVHSGKAYPTIGHFKTKDGSIYWTGTDKDGNFYKLDASDPDLMERLKALGDPNIDWDHVAAAQDKSSAAEKPEPNALPDGYDLKQNYPNPFNPTTTIGYSLPESRHVRLDIINIQGQVIKTLVDGDVGAGEHSIVWNGDDESGARVASGIYLYRLKAGEYSVSKKMTLLK